MSYEFNVTLNTDFDTAMEQVRAALQAEHLGIVSEVDVQAVLKAKMDKTIAPYRIWGACSPKLADEILTEEPNAGTLLPCNLVLYQKAEGEVVVSFMDPVTVLGLAQSDTAQTVARDAKLKLQAVVERLAV